MDNRNTYRNITLSTKVSAAQKAEYVKIAASHNISVSHLRNLNIVRDKSNPVKHLSHYTPNKTIIDKLTKK